MLEGKEEERRGELPFTKPRIKKYVWTRDTRRGFSASRAHTSSGRRHRTHRRRRKGGRKAWLRIHNGIVWLFLSPFPTATLLPHPPSLYRLKLSSSSFPLHPVYPSLSLSDDFSGKVIRVRNEIVNCCEATLKLKGADEMDWKYFVEVSSSRMDREENSNGRVGDGEKWIL